MWFAGCNNIDWIYSGLNKINNFLEKDSIIIFTEANTYHNDRETNKTKFPYPYIDIKNLKTLFDISQNHTDKEKKDNEKYKNQLSELYKRFLKIKDYPFFKYNPPFHTTALNES